MRKLAAFATLAAVIAACGSDGASRADEKTGRPSSTAPDVVAAGSCAPTVALNGALYTGGVSRLYEPVEFGDPIAGGIVPACNDTNMSDEEDLPAVLTSIEGVSPDVGVGMGGEVYLGPGYLIQSPRHPLHDAVCRTEPDETEGFRCEVARTLTGRVDFTPGFGTVIRLKAVDDPSSALLRPYDGLVFVDGGTEYAGLDRDGIPYLEEGLELSVAAMPCEGDGDARKLVVTRMTAAS